jgi:ABC-type dipeptide/oligopeptide/nickel transport system permease component
LACRRTAIVLPLIAARLPATFQLTVAAMLLAIALAVPLGVLAATHRSRLISRHGVALVGQSVRTSAGHPGDPALRRLLGALPTSGGR